MREIFAAEWLSPAGVNFDIGVAYSRTVIKVCPRSKPANGYFAAYADRQPLPPRGFIDQRTALATGSAAKAVYAYAAHR